MLKYIEIEKGINLENEWVKSFIQIGQIWESWSDQIGGKVSGYLNMYGVNLDSIFTIDSHIFKVNVYKKYKNTGYASAAYSCITTVDILVKNKILIEDFKVVRANWLRLVGINLSKFTKSNIYDGFIFRAHSYELIDLIKESAVHKLPDFGWMKCNEGLLTFKFYSSPSTVERVSDYIRGMNKILQTTANNA